MLKFYPSDFEIVPVMGVLGRDNCVYFSLQDVCNLLQKKERWVCRIRMYHEIDPEWDVHRSQHPMIHEEELGRILKEEGSCSRGNRLFRVLYDVDPVHYVECLYNEHVLSACPCAHFTTGMWFRKWVDSLRRDLFRQ